MPGPNRAGRGQTSRTREPIRGRRPNHTARTQRYDEHMKIVAVLVLLGGLLPAFGQEGSNDHWEHLRSLRKGEKIEVVEQSLAKHSG